MKQVTYTGPVDPLDGTNQFEVDVDGKTYVLPVGVEVEVPVKVADRLALDDLVGHNFTVTDPSSGGADNKPSKPPARQSAGS